MELRQLSYFKAVAEELHFGRAATKMRIAQPALSNHVISLEKELGCALFIRSTRKVELTRAGETFYERCVRILSDVDLTTRAAGGSRIRQIRIDTVYPATMGILPTFLAKIARKFPDVRIHISSGNTGDIIRSLESEPRALFPTRYRIFEPCTLALSRRPSSTFERLDWICAVENWGKKLRDVAGHCFRYFLQSCDGRVFSTPLKMTCI